LLRIVETSADLIRPCVQSIEPRRGVIMGLDCGKQALNIGVGPFWVASPDHDFDPSQGFDDTGPFHERPRARDGNLLQPPEARQPPSRGHRRDRGRQLGAAGFSERRRVGR